MDQEIQKLIDTQMCCNNYLIEGEGPICAVYFSSNGITLNDTVESFRKRIIEKDYYEFYKIRIQKATKHIFVRDILKTWYSKGINNDLNSIEKLVDFLKEQTKGFRVITVGSSAGGYAAVLCGILLNAIRIFTFSGQFSICKSKSKRFFQLKELIENSNTPIYYMLPSNFDDDQIQLEKIEDSSNVHYCIIKSGIHGIPLIKDTLKIIINLNDEDLLKIYNNSPLPIKERDLILKHFGITKFFVRLIKKNFIR